MSTFLVLRVVLQIMLLSEAAKSVRDIVVAIRPSAPEDGTR